MKRQKITVFLLVLLTSISPFTAFPQFTLSGKVTDKDSGKPLSGANIIADKSAYSASSSADGSYSIKRIKQGSYTFRVSFIGYKTFEQIVTINNDRILDFSLEYSPVMSDEVIVQASRVNEKVPATYTNIDKKEIADQNTGQDLPFILQLTPSVVTTSDAGTGVGYTGIRIRGTDITRINVTLNGVPVNDAESQDVYFVDLPDLASSTNNIQIQRGVGTSANGAAAFGASINIETTRLNSEPYAEINSSAGSFNTFKNTLNFGSGLIGGNWAFDGRASAISSDGYIDRGWSNLKSFYLSGGYFGEKSILKAIVSSGMEKTYQAWYGTPKDSLKTNRTYNPSGIMYNDSGRITGYYNNQTDNYWQTYYQLHFAHEFSKSTEYEFGFFLYKGQRLL